MAVDELILGDCLYHLRTTVAPDSVDLIYADPPFNSGRDYTFSGRANAEPSFTDTWTYDDALYEKYHHMSGSLAFVLDSLQPFIGRSDKAMYLSFIAAFLNGAAIVMKDTGSIYLHIDPKMSHYIRLMMDDHFINFQNEIIWAYQTGGASKKRWSRKHDTILFYTLDDKRYTFNTQRERQRYEKPFFGTSVDEQGAYYDVIVRDVWNFKAVLNISKQRTGYPTQKPLDMLERIVVASSNEGDVVLDPFCGSGTTLVAAKKHNRRYIGIDVNTEALAVSQKRLNEIE